MEGFITGILDLFPQPGAGSLRRELTAALCCLVCCLIDLSMVTQVGDAAGTPASWPHAGHLRLPPGTSPPTGSQRGVGTPWGCCTHGSGEGGGCPWRGGACSCGGPRGVGVPVATAGARRGGDAAAAQGAHGMQGVCARWGTGAGKVAPVPVWRHPCQRGTAGTAPVTRSAVPAGRHVRVPAL